MEKVVALAWLRSALALPILRTSHRPDETRDSEMFKIEIRDNTIPEG